MRETKRANPSARGTHSTVLIVTVVLFGVVSAVHAGTISELNIAPVQHHGSQYPAFIELVTSDLTQPFDLLILDGSQGREGRILQRYTIDPAGADMVVLHEGDWPTPVTAEVRAIPVDDLNLVASTFSNFAGTSRWLFLIDHELANWPTTGQAPTPPDQWTGVMDSVGFYWGNFWTIDPAVGSAAFELADDHALALHTVEDGNDPTYSFGPVDATGYFADGYQFSPGLFNPQTIAHHHPEPATLILVGALPLWLSRRLTLRLKNRG